MSASGLSCPLVYLLFWQNVFAVKVVEETFCHLLQKDQDFEVN